MSGNLLVRFDEGRVGRTECVALSPTLPVNQTDRHILSVLLVQAQAYREEFGFKAKTEFREGLKRTIAGYQQHRKA